MQPRIAAFAAQHAARAASTLVGMTPDLWWAPIAGPRPTVDGQRMSARLATFSRVLAPQLAARTPPTEQARWRMEKLAQLSASPEKFSVRVTESTVATPGGTVACRLYEPEAATPRGLLVYIHGGGWHLGSAAGYDAVATFLSSRINTRVFSLDYRLAPEHPFPAAFLDALAGYKYAVEQAARWDVSGPIVIAGDSAGGNLAAAIAYALSTDENYRPDLVALVYPALDARLDRYPSSDLFTTPLSRASVDRAFDWYVPEQHNRTDPRFSIVGADKISTMPPTYIATAGMDVLRDQGERFGSELKAAGVPATVQQFPNMPHGFLSMLVDPGARTASGRIAEAIRAHMLNASA
ncbi:alpha/beta hydrolase [Hoyosella subflava]|uniref:Alpha/beta hydrolase fold-3 n=1 Tax=Hoyosella subflava (strain DSM 45089 / JCM 17490 / NBRC 109087 / DQS3-9A1) TaxID=443218 RepID=F6EGI5_HOYSD|nr:alpha/beta hydrolase [Hoyosella subflava]AEF41038.1 Alpha/beta hydrolase fold-3 [Hoyosella subflava DQS3-9A1]